MENLVLDLRYAVRVLLSRPSFLTIALLVLALGIGANTAIFSIVNALLLRPLPGVEDPDRIVAVYTSDFSSGRYGTSSFPDFQDYRQQNDVFSDIAAGNNQPMNLTGDEPQRVSGALVTHNYFSVLGVKAVAGRTFLPEDDQMPGGEPVAVLSYSTWQTRFGGRPDVVGSPIAINNQDFTIVGVADKDFGGTSLGGSLEVWIPISTFTRLNPTPGSSSRFSQRGSRFLFLIGRLKPEVTLEQAQAQIDTIAAQLAATYPRTNMGTLASPDQPRPMTLVPINHAMVGPATRVSTKRFAQLLMAIVGFVLMIACANVANLLLARASARQKEIALRVALGANRGRIVRQLLTESVLLSLVGGAVGILFAVWLSDVMKSSAMLAAFAAMDVSLDGRVLAFTLILSVITGVVFGFFPALQSSKPDLVSALKENRTGGIGISRSITLRDALVVVQVAVSLVLLVGAGLFLRSLQRAYAADLGFSTENALLVSVDAARQGYPETKGRAFYSQLAERVAALPGARGVTLAQFIPISQGGSRTSVIVDGYTPQPREDMELNLNVVDSSYFETLGIPLLSGRNFDGRDTTQSAPVVVINDAMAHRYWPGQNAVGKRISMNGPDGPYSEVIGVAKTGKYRNLREDPLPYMYLPLSQQYRGRVTLFIRATNEPTELLSTLRSEVQRLDSNLPLFDVRTLSEHLGNALAQERTYATLIGAFALLALLLAAVGIYGLMSYAVAQRTHELGIRMALGAKKSDVIKLVLSRSLSLAALGIGAGVALAFGVTHLVSTMLYETSHTDPVTFAGVAGALAGVLIVASYLPARRATLVDPMIALKYE